MSTSITVGRKSNSARVMQNVAQLAKKQVYVGITADTAQNRNKTLSKLAGKKTDSDDVNSAELLWLFSKGSPLNGTPARPVIEPAIVASGNKEAITAELSEAAKATLAGDGETATQHLRRAGLAGQVASQKWFTDPRNSWAPNAPSTIAAKGSDRPGIDTSAMRQAITNVVKEG